MEHGTGRIRALTRSRKDPSKARRVDKSTFAIMCYSMDLLGLRNTSMVYSKWPNFFMSPLHYRVRLSTGLHADMFIITFYALIHDIKVHVLLYMMDISGCKYSIVKYRSSIEIDEVYTSCNSIPFCRQLN